MINTFWKIVKIITLGFGMLFIITFVVALYQVINEDNKDKNPVIPTYSESHTTEKYYTLNSKELFILDTILDDDAKQFSNGGDSLLKSMMLHATISEIVLAYRHNEVAADQKYYNKTLLLTGKIDSIKSGLLNIPYIVMQAPGFTVPELKFKSGLVDRIAQLKRGQLLNVVCKSDGSVIGSPMFVNCEFASDYAAHKNNETRNGIITFLQNKTNADKVSKGLAIFPIYLARNVPDSECIDDKQRCVKAIRKIKLDRVTRQKIISLAQTLKIPMNTDKK